MPCTPVSLNTPSSASGSAIPGFGRPFALPLHSVSPVPPGFPEDLLDILNQIELLVPPGALQAPLNPNFGKDVFDGIMKLLDQFMPFLMLYKFFLPVLNLIICIIEVLCALMNPFALISALNRLFTQCIPQFLNLFPVFALIIMIISLLLLILALIEYLATQIEKLVAAVLRNIAALNRAFQFGDSAGILAIAAKLGALLCAFQNLFILFTIFNTILDLIKDILSLVFGIPPCHNGGSGDTNSCCTPETCPAIVQSQYTRQTGTFKYFPAVVGTLATLPTFPGFTIRQELWQLYDLDQNQAQAFSNIYNAYDITNTSPKPIFFPSGTTYDLNSDLRQVPYTIDLRVFYNPTTWGRTGLSRFIRFTNCIVTSVPTPNLEEANDTIQNVSTAVVLLVGGSGFEDDGITPLQAYGANGITPITGIATLNNFFHLPTQASSSPPPLNINDGYNFLNIEYTFKPNTIPLIQKNLVTVGCNPELAFSRGFINNVFANDVGLKTQQLTNLINGNGNVFPDTAAAQQCMATAVTALQSNLTNEGVANFQATTSACLSTLQNATNNALNSLIGIGADPCHSTFSLNPSVQFTTLPIIISVNINERNGLPLTNNLSPTVAASIAKQLVAYPSFGQASVFTYDGYQAFTSNLTSTEIGTGQVSVSFDNNMLCSNTFSPPNYAIQTIDYQFIYTSSVANTQSQLRRDAGDIVRDANNTGGD
jgi:hypothetical protein